MIYGVGIIGAGPGVAALHAPTLARLSDDFRIVHIADAGSGRADGIAEHLGARSSRGFDDLLADPDVDVVAICSPPGEHAEQILASVAAGKRAIMCEKPVGTTVDEAQRAIEACRDAGIPLLVGTNHYFDPAWGRAKHYLTATGGPVLSISVTLALPPNTRYHDAVAELGTPSGSRPAPDLSRPDIAAIVVRQLLSGLAIHDLPLVRDLAPRFERVVFARALAPIGFAVGFLASGIPIQLTTVMLPDGATGRRPLATDRDDGAGPAGRHLSSGVRARGQRTRAGPLGRRARHHVRTRGRGRLSRRVARARGTARERDAGGVRGAARRCTLRPSPRGRGGSADRGSGMTRPIAVHSGLGTYRVAAAELPASARIADSPDRAIVVVSGDGSWWDAAIRALDEGAAGVVVARPASAPGGALSSARGGSEPRPLVIERPLLRADVACAAIAAGLPAPTALVVECHAPAASLPAALATHSAGRVCSGRAADPELRRKPAVPVVSRCSRPPRGCPYRWSSPPSRARPPSGACASPRSARPSSRSTVTRRSCTSR